MGDIFIQGVDDQACVSIGDKFTDELSYIIGYREAGDALVDKAIALTHPYKDRLVFPICFNYRQFIELILKQLILDAEITYNNCESIGMQRKNSRHNFAEKMNLTHNIEKLLSRLIIILDNITDKEINKNVIELIMEYHQMDPTGQKFRYPVSSKNEKYFEIPENFDLEKIKAGIKTIADCLMGVDAYLCQFGNFVKISIEEIDSMYGIEI
jgi:hypothetical protein